jgi:hypothetical protein
MDAASPPTSANVRIPYSNCESKSLPKSSVPRTYFDPGGTKLVPVVSKGLCGDISGAARQREKRKREKRRVYFKFDQMWANPS